MPDKKTPQQPAEVPTPGKSPEIRPDYQPEAPIFPEPDPGTTPPRLPDNPWPEKEPAQPTEPQPLSAHKFFPAAY